MELTEQILEDFVLETKYKKELRLHGGELSVKLNTRVKDEHIEIIFDFLQKYNVNSLDLSYNEITDVGFKELLYSLARSKHKLYQLNLMCNKITTKGLRHLANAASQYTIKSLRLNGNKFGSKGAPYLAFFIANNTCVEDLDIAETDLNIGGIITMVFALSEPSVYLYSINLSRPLLGVSRNQSLAADYLGRMLTANFDLRILVLKKYGFEDDDIYLLSQGLYRNKGDKYVVSTMDLKTVQDEDARSWDSFTTVEETEEYLEEIERRKKSLEIDKTTKEMLAYNEFMSKKIVTPGFIIDAMRDLDIRVLGASRREHISNLTHLDLSCNNISDGSIEHLKPYLLSGPPLTILNLAHNSIGDVGAIELSKCLPSTNIEFLDIGYNQIKHSGMRFLLHQVSCQGPLKTIYLWGNNFKQETFMMIHRAISCGIIFQENIDVIPYITDDEYFGAYNQIADRRQLEYYKVSECPLYENKRKPKKKEIHDESMPSSIDSN